MLNFLGIGAQKAGTTWLYTQLARHPQVGFPKGKEIHFWDWVQAGRRPCDIGWYLRQFGADAGRVLGEITPDYAVLEERYIRQIHNLNPDLKILFILRNPIERAWSAARMGLARLGMEREEASDRWFIDVFRSAYSVARGDYETTLRRWTGVFSRQQILLLYYEDLEQNPLQLLEQTAQHLGVGPDFFRALAPSEIRRRIHPGAGFHLERCYRLTEPLMKELCGIYASRIESLSHYLGRDLSHWLEVPVE